jgi:hypothetical protein
MGKNVNRIETKEIQFVKKMRSKDFSKKSYFEFFTILM